MLPARWQIELLGKLRVHDGMRTIDRFRTQKTGALLAYLALNADRGHPRDVLADLFWGDSDPSAARVNLRVAINSLRQQLEARGVATGSVLEASQQQVRLRPEAITTDVAQFEAGLREANQASDRSTKLRLLKEAVALYGGRLLPHVYDDWAFEAQERLATEYAQALADLDTLCEVDGDLTEALDIALKRVALDPADEAAQARAIYLHMALGQTSVAWSRYRNLERILQDNFHIAPAPSTRRLLEGISEQSFRRTADPSTYGQMAVASAVSNSADRNVPVVDLASARLERAEAHPATFIRLPIPLTQFFGREAELQQIARLCGAEGMRLITLTGPGGSGKTRLAVEAARLAQDTFAAVCFVALAEQSRPDAVPDAVAAVLGLSQSATQDLLEACLRRLAVGKTLLILDNFEHLLGDDDSLPASLAFIDALIRSAPELTCLVTSRRRLGLGGERELVILPLPVPDSLTDREADTAASTDLGLISPAVALFVNRAQAVKADFQLTARNAIAISAVCNRLEGLPLAIELAAGWAQSLTPAQMLQQMSSVQSGRFSLLVSRDRNVVPRHRSLEAAIDWSVTTLTPELSRLLRRLTVFRAGWTHEAAEAVCFDLIDPSEGNGKTCLDLLTSLRERNLLTTEERSLGTEAYLRFRILETIRECAAENLPTDERETMERRHAEYFLDLVETAERESRKHDATSWQMQLGEETENLRSAVTYFLERGPDGAEQAARLATTLALHWARLNVGTRYAESLGWLRAIAEDDVSPIQQARLLLARALVGHGMSFAVRSADYERCLTMFRHQNDRYGEALAFAEVRQPGGSFRPIAERPPLLRSSLAVLEGFGDKRSAARVLLWLVHDDPSLSAAERDAYFERSVRLSHECGDIDGHGLALQERGWSLYCLGTQTAAEAALKAALDFEERNGLRERMVGTLWIMGRLFAEQKRLEDARAAHVKRSLLNASLGQSSYVGSELGDLCAEEGDLAEARSWYEKSNCLRGLCSVLICQGDYTAAEMPCRRLLEDALTELSRAEANEVPTDEQFNVVTRWSVQNAYHSLALLEAAAGRIGAATEYLRAASGAATSAPASYEAGKSAAANRFLHIIGRLAILRGETRFAAELFAASLNAVEATDNYHIPLHERRFQQSSIDEIERATNPSEWRAGWEAGASLPWQSVLDEAVSRFLTVNPNC